MSGGWELWHAVLAEACATSPVLALTPAEAGVPRALPRTHQEPRPRPLKPYSCPDLLAEGHSGPASACQSQIQPISLGLGRRSRGSSAALGCREGMFWVPSGG